MGRFAFGQKYGTAYLSVLKRTSKYSRSCSLVAELLSLRKTGTLQYIRAKNTTLAPRRTLEDWCGARLPPNPVAGYTPEKEGPTPDAATHWLSLPERGWLNSRERRRNDRFGSKIPGINRS